MPLPLERLGLGWRSHVAALRWLGLLHRRPAVFHTHMEMLSRRARARAGLLLHVHALPWLALLAGSARWALGLMGETSAPGRDLAAPFAVALAGPALGALVWALAGVNLGLAVSLLGSGSLATVAGFDLSLHVPAYATATLFGAAIGLVSRASGHPPWPWEWLALGAIAFLAFGAAGGWAIGLLTAASAVVVATRVYTWPRHVLVTTAVAWGAAPERAYRWHPMAWDDVCLLPFRDLPLLLVALTERSPRAGVTELARLYAEAPQRWPVAARAVAVLSVRAAAREPDLRLLPQRLHALDAAACGNAARAARLRELAARIARRQAVIDASQPDEKLAQARLLLLHIEDFRHDAAVLPLADELTAAAANWLERANRQVDAAKAAAQQDRVPRVFRAGNPIDRAREAFVPRAAVFAALRREVLTEGGSPGLLLYGRRRTGKSTVLRNLAAFLPPGARVAELSMEDPRAFTSLQDFAPLLAERVAAACPAERRPVLRSVDLTGLRAFLAQADAALQPDRRIVIGIDEYEFLDQKIGAGALPRDLLALVRTAIQAFPRIVWLFAGSLAIEELRHAEWTSCLAGARTVDVPPFGPAETFALLTDPLAHSPLWARDDPARPRFDTAFWGEGTVERIQAETGGWPHLVQLLAEVTVDLLSERDDRSVSPALFERALDRTVDVGDAVLRLLLEVESRLPGEWEYLARFRDRASQAPPDDDGVRRSLRRRLLVVEEGEDWRLRVPVMQRWLRRHG